MERRLIDANALEAEFAGPFVQTYKECREALREAPTIDAVEVVRCRDCKHMGDPILCRMMVYDGKTQQLSDWTRDNGFCDFGVRREPDGE